MASLALLAGGCGNNGGSGALSSSAALSSDREAKLRDLETQLSALKSAEYAVEHGPQLREWAPQREIDFGAFHGELVDGWGIESDPDGTYAWFVPKTDRSRGVEIRLQRRVTDDDDALGVAFRALIATERGLEANDLQPLSGRFFAASPVFDVKSARVGHFGPVRALIIDGLFTQPKLARTMVFVDGEEETDRPAEVESLFVTYPLSLAERYHPEADALFEKLSIAQHPLGRMCGEHVVAQPGQPCVRCCSGTSSVPAERRKVRETCLDDASAKGYESVCALWCDLYCLPTDPSKVEANKTRFRARSQGEPKKCDPNDPLCAP